MLHLHIAKKTKLNQSIRILLQENVSVMQPDNLTTETRLTVLPKMISVNGIC